MILYSYIEIAIYYTNFFSLMIKPKKIFYKTSSLNYSLSRFMILNYLTRNIK